MQIRELDYRSDAAVCKVANPGASFIFLVEIMTMYVTFFPLSILLYIKVYLVFKNADNGLLYWLESLKCFSIPAIHVSFMNLHLASTFYV